MSILDMSKKTGDPIIIDYNGSPQDIGSPGSVSYGSGSLSTISSNVDILRREIEDNLPALETGLLGGQLGFATDTLSDKSIMVWKDRNGSDIHYYYEDGQQKTSGTDPVVGYLDTKVRSGTGTTVTTQVDGVSGEEYLQVDSTTTGLTNFKYKATTSSQTPPTAAGRIRWNAATQIDATEIYINHVDDEGTNVSSWLKLLIEVGAELIMTGSDGTGQVFIVTVISEGVSENTYTVEYIGGTKQFSNNETIDLITGLASDAIWTLDTNGDVILVDQTRKLILSKTGTALDVTGDFIIQGDIIQNGSSYESHLEQVYTTKDYIITREGAVGGLGAGQYTGFQATLYDGVNDGRLVFDSSGTARVGDVGSEVPLTGRAESGSLTDGNLVEWDSATETIVDSGVSVVGLDDIYVEKEGQGFITDANVITGTQSFQIGTGSNTPGTEFTYLNIDGGSDNRMFQIASTYGTDSVFYMRGKYGSGTNDTWKSWQRIIDQTYGDTRYALTTDLSDYVSKVNTGTETMVGSLTTNGIIKVGTVDLGTFNGVGAGYNGDAQYRIGQDSTHNLLMGWDYNATAANATGFIETFGKTNLLEIQRGTGGVTEFSSVGQISALSVDPNSVRIGHKDFNNATGYGFRQSSDGTCYLVSPSTKEVKLRTNDSDRLVASDGGITVTGKVTAKNSSTYHELSSSSIDEQIRIGNARTGSNYISFYRGATRSGFIQARTDSPNGATTPLRVGSDNDLLLDPVTGGKVVVDGDLVINDELIPKHVISGFTNGANVTSNNITIDKYPNNTLFIRGGFTVNASLSSNVILASKTSSDFLAIGSTVRYIDTTEINTATYGSAKLKLVYQSGQYRILTWKSDGSSGTGILPGTWQLNDVVTASL